MKQITNNNSWIEQKKNHQEKEGDGRITVSQIWEISYIDWNNNFSKS